MKIVTLFHLLICVSTGQIIHTKLNDTGIHLENIGTMLQYKGEIHIVTSIDLPKIDEITNSLHECLFQLKTLCTKISNHNTVENCNNLRAEAKWHLEDIQKQDQKLREMYGRQKRALMDVGGKIANYLFGTMDAEDANQIYRNLETLNNDQARIIDIEKEQIAVIKSNFDSLLKPIKELQNDTDEIKDRLNKLIDRTRNEVEAGIKQQNIKQEITEISSLLIIKCLHIDRLQDEASEIITTTENNKLHPLVISYHNLVKIIQNMTDQINKKTIEHQILKQITRTSHIETNNKLIIKITIDIIDSEELSLSKVYLTPREKNGQLQIYDINSEYIATNKVKTTFIEITEDEYKSCRKIIASSNSEYTYCKNTHQVTHSNNQCLLAILNNPLSIKNLCKSIKAKPSNLFIKMVNPHSWLYSIHDPTKLLIECPEIHESMETVNEGILTFLSDCKLTTKDFIIHIKGNSKKIEIEEPKIYHSTENQETGRITATGTSAEQIPKIKIRSHTAHNNEILDESKKINHLQENIAKLAEHRREMNTQKLFSLSTTATFGICFTIAIAYLIFKNRSNKQKHRTSIEIKTVEEAQPPGTEITITEDEPNNKIRRTI